MKNLIVNADDFAWTEGVNRGIAESHQRGIVTSTSMMANGSSFVQAVKIAKATPGLGVGVHLNLSDGTPSAKPEKTATLLNAEGQFNNGPESLLLKITTRGIDLKQVETEWDAQIGKIRDAGILPSHLDGHKHVHMLPKLFEIALRLAKRHAIGAVRISHEASTLRLALSSGSELRTSKVLKQGVQARGLKMLARDARLHADRAGISTADYFCGIAQTGEMTIEGVARLLRSLPEGTTELMCHPGYADRALEHSATRLQESREAELHILTSPEIRNLVASEGIRLIDYSFVTSEA